eukprot:563918-Alexandrium_andersonii.AAC.1
MQDSGCGQDVLPHVVVARVVCHPLGAPGERGQTGKGSGEIWNAGEHQHCDYKPKHLAQAAS